ncbi:MAG TPA: HlyD family efflux transporter periplasmic adaptor subunit [Gemmatimonadales bacterium]|nr:HlyD family efflux transporter periplasmic adaptor subunit [Gemmatimonadales bacterium]
MSHRIRIPIRAAGALWLLGALSACTRDRAPEAVGTLEVVQVDLAPMVPARVLRVNVNEGDVVQAGDTVAVLTQAGLNDQVAEARARVRAAEAALAETERGSRPEEIARAEQDLAAAQAVAGNARADLERARALAENNVIARQQLDQAESRAAEAEARARAVAEQLRLVREGPRAERKAAARAELARARAALQAMEASAGDLVLVAPVAGTVLVRAAEPGEVIPAAVPAVTLGDVARPWVRVYVGQDILPTLHVGDTLVARLDAFPDRRFPGRIVALATQAEYTPRVALTERERADLLFGVKVEFRDTTGMLKPGLPVTVVVAGGSGR